VLLAVAILLVKGSWIVSSNQSGDRMVRMTLIQNKAKQRPTSQRREGVIRIISLREGGLNLAMATKSVIGPGMDAPDA
jgi:hypothetical protein